MKFIVHQRLSEETKEVVGEHTNCPSCDYPISGSQDWTRRVARSHAYVAHKVQGDKVQFKVQK